MLNVGPQEILLILVVALVIVGPQRLPELARSIGKGLRSLRVAQDEVRRTVSEVLEPREIADAASEIRRTGREIREGLRDITRPEPGPGVGAIRSGEVPADETTEAPRAASAGIPPTTEEPPAGATE